jgi:holliday junction DNA helicase RuvA
MYEFIKSKVAELNPAYAVMDTGSVAYFVHISINTYSLLKEGNDHVLYIHQVIREDAQLLFGFADKQERELFRLLITVSGIGANTARMMLSSQSVNDLKNAILTGNVPVLQGIKGIGAKTAQRIIIDLKDKISKTGADADIFMSEGNTKREEALSALVMLGFNKASVEKILDKIFRENPNLSVEQIIKLSLKQL